MRNLFLDYETFWSQTHSLSKMNPVAYVQHRETEIQSMAYAYGDDEVEVLFGDEIKAWWKEQDVTKTRIIAHNGSGFDHMISAWRYGVRPAQWACTLAMARPVYNKVAGGSLKALAELLGLKAKGNLEAIGTKGRKLKDFTPDEIEAMREYNKTDVELCRGIFYHLEPKTPEHEMEIMDMTTRMLLAPKFRVDVPLLRETLATEIERKEQALELLAEKLDVHSADAMKKRLMSNPQLAHLLEELDCPVPMKVSPTTGKATFAFAKNDEAFLSLMEHPNHLVSAAVGTRLGIKSSQLETRLQTFITMAEATGGRMPIALNYWGAHTGRFSGAFGANQQNLPRVNPKEPKLTDALRRCLIVPKGHKVVVADLSGIELRVNHFLWKVKSSMDLYAKDPEADLYKEFATKLYNIDHSEVTKDQRQFAKLCQLGLGFGMSHQKFQIAAAQQGVELSLKEARDAVGKWREVYLSIVNGWEECGNALYNINDGLRSSIDPWGLCQTRSYGILLPTGRLRYPGLHQEENKKGKLEWVYGSGRHVTRTYSSKITENIVQSLARHILAEQMITIQERYPISHTVHDEVILVVPEDEAETALKFMLDTMKTPPEWWPEIVLWAEGDIADNYGDAK